jgi:hypothetical protein
MASMPEGDAAFTLPTTAPGPDAAPIPDRQTVPRPRFDRSVKVSGRTRPDLLISEGGRLPAINPLGSRPVARRAKTGRASLLHNVGEKSLPPMKAMGLEHVYADGVDF